MTRGLSFALVLTLTFQSVAFAETSRVTQALQDSEKVRQLEITTTIQQIGETQTKLNSLELALQNAKLENTGRTYSIWVERAAIVGLIASVGGIVHGITHLQGGEAYLLPGISALYGTLGLIVSGGTLAGAKIAELKLTSDEVASLQINIRKTKAELTTLSAKLTALAK